MMIITCTIKIKIMKICLYNKKILTNWISFVFAKLATIILIRNMAYTCAKLIFMKNLLEWFY